MLKWATVSTERASLTATVQTIDVIGWNGMFKSRDSFV